MKYRTPDPDRIDEMCDAFMWYHETHEKARTVNMRQTHSRISALNPNFCGTPGCHAGLFGTLFEDDTVARPYSVKNRSFTQHADMMAKYLYKSGRVSMRTLIRWAKKSPHWPYANHSIFSDASAFGGANYDYVSIMQIVKTWRTAAENIRKEMKK